MPLLPPTVGSLSTASNTIYVSGLLDGATVTVHMEGVSAPILSATPGTPDAHLPITAGVLVAGRGVWAIQKIGTATSLAPSKNEYQIIQGVPNPLGPPAFGLVPVACGMAVRVDGLLTGAEAQLDDNLGPNGTATEWESVARVSLTRAVDHGGQLRATQTAGGVTSPPTMSPRAEEPPNLAGQHKLPPPTFGRQPADCDPAVLVHDIIPGARVIVNRPTGPEFAVCADPGVWLFLSHAVKEHELLFLRQEVDSHCELSGSDGPMIEVGQAKPVPKPMVTGPLCVGTERLTVSNLVPFAKLVLSYNGQTWEARAGRDTSKEITLAPPLEYGPVTAVQERCGNWSDESDPVPVNSAPIHIDAPSLPGPVYACAQAVRIENIHPGAKVRLSVIGLNGSVRHTERLVYQDWCDMPVVALTQHEKLFAIQFGCGHWSGQSNVQKALAEPAVGAPRVRKDLHECMDSVPVIDVVPGARVHVYIDDKWAGSAATGSKEITVPVSLRLKPKQKVKAWQNLCFREGRPQFSPEVEVAESPGTWTVLRDATGNDKIAQILGVHAALLRTGHILYFGGDQHDADENDAGRSDPKRLNATCLFDCTTHAITRVGSPTSDVFCAGQALMPDGRLLVAGGTEDFPAAVHGGGHGKMGHFLGHRHAWIFDPMSKVWTRVDDLNPQRGRTDGGGRWYPTLVTLADGRILALSGHPAVTDLRHNNTSLETYTPAPPPFGTWQLIGTADNDEVQVLYPRVHVIRGGVVSTSPMAGKTKRWAVGTDPLVWADLGPAPPDGRYHGYGTPSVLLPLWPPPDGQDYQFELLVCGGTTAYRRNLVSGGWMPTAARKLSGTPLRKNASAVLLPTGEVFVCGGVSDTTADAAGNELSSDTTAVLSAEVYDPVVNEWKVWAVAEVPRNYHSVALLMPDGRVWTAAGDFNAAQGLANRELRIEIFAPWYCCVSRPLITSAPPSAIYGVTFQIRCPQAAPDTTAALIRAGSMTHAFNSDQRYVGLKVKHLGGDRLELIAPSDAEVAPPGYYLLYVLTREAVTGRRVPSIGAFIRLSG